jgi:hypothetical protein
MFIDYESMFIWLLVGLIVLKRQKLYLALKLLSDLNLVFEFLISRIIRSLSFVQFWNWSLGRFTIKVYELSYAMGCLI